MPRRRQLRGVKICAQCGEGYDAFKAMESRGHFCSPACLAAARAAHRHAPEPVLGGGGAAAILAP
jgi:hypothetical protein